jgi:uncharacterized protein YbjT (DUF2867 family)
LNWTHASFDPKLPSPKQGENSMFVITGATGNTGSAAAKALLSAGKQVRAVVRDAKKAEALKALGAEVFVADITDPAALERAVAGAEGVYFLSPPDMTAKNFVEDRKALTEKQIATFARAKVPHVVLLSSVGAQHPGGSGPIRTVHNAEQQLRRAGIPSTFVRASYFVENWGAVAHPVKQDGVLPSFIALDRATPMVSTQDIGKTAAQALLDGPRGVRVIELAGPTDPTPNEIAATFAKILGRPVKAVAAPVAAVVPTFTSFGISQNVAELFQEMYEGFASGHVVAESGEHARGTTSLEDTLRGLVG